MLKQNILSSIISIFVLLSSGCKNNPTGAVQDQHYKIAFIARQQIYIMNDDGSDQHKLTSQRGFEQSIGWPSDGSKIGFSSDRTGSFEIYTVNLDGTDLQQLTAHPGFNSFSLSWSPDGSMIAFDSNHEGNSEIYLMDAFGGSKQRLTNNSRYDGGPDWSPDGSRILFLGGQPTQIFVFNLGGAGLKQLTNFEAGVGCSGDWSPDGSRIAFVPFFGDIYVMSSEGKDLQRLTSNFGRAGTCRVCWSPNGEKLAFFSVHEGTSEIYVMNADGSDLKRLTNGLNRANALDEGCWSQDGARIVFSAYVEDLNRNQIYLINTDGTGLEQLPSPYRCYQPKWSPVRY